MNCCNTLINKRPYFENYGGGGNCCVIAYYLFRFTVLMYEKWFLFINMCNLIIR